MIQPSDRASTLRAIRSVLAADCACTEEDLTRDGLVITEAAERPGRRRYPLLAKPLLIVTKGTGVVVSCHASRMAALRTILDGCPRDVVFGAAILGRLSDLVQPDRQYLRGPVLKLACSPDRFRPAPIPPRVRIDVIEDAAIAELFRYPGFTHALSYRPDDPRPDILAAVARRDGTILGIAAAAEDADELWTIGVDVVEAARGAGIGRAIVGRVTEIALDRGKIPYYSVAVSNVRSHALAIGLGYWPAWTEVHARDTP